ncbi:8003_t:CDS:2 [Dentiscutata erythropus]|uniref:8003_t:CDS:1 n=1 Tax=Dentiscutata erythropus TaxID=1348616 RepID=A0A9N8ZGX3_9GLOM|nr:8003_t:CDS:2 [Dentiscutata erythropus]
MENQNTRDFLKRQWPSILASKKDIKLSNPQISHGGKVISTKIAIRITSSNKDRSEFFERWTPLYDEESINILGGDFNTNTNRVSQASAQSDATCIQLKRLTNNFVNLAFFEGNNPFLTFFQNTWNNKTMATRLDSIFIDKNYVLLVEKTETLFGNSDYLRDRHLQATRIRNLYKWTTKKDL